MIRQQHLVASAVTLLVIATGWARAADRVIETTGGKENAHSGKITRDDRDGVAIRMSSGITPEFRREFVKKVEYECLASHYASGESLFDLGQYGLAQMRYAQAEEARDLAEWAKQYVFRRLAQCHERLSGKEHDQKAVEYWEKTRNAVPAGKGLFMREAVEGLLNGYAKLGLWDKASQMLAELEGMGDSEKLMARVYGAGINEKRGRFPEAADAYKKVSEGRPEPNQGAGPGRPGALLGGGQELGGGGQRLDQDSRHGGPGAGERAGRRLPGPGREQGARPFG
jgi:hypothetical protein